ncbi:nucleotide exchange factor Sil1, partial [Condylostylus longicornis]|uniref:nucleotide exchange factor Sil1 n=1 Tax=Condylostylus longicornis TaxID=2530218 RepID=UPI00244DCAE0
MNKVVFILVILSFCRSSISDEVTVQVDSHSSENDTFVPTKDWQVIKEGQSIPAGLHVRLNLETGVREAKLLDDSEIENEEKKNTELNIVPDDSQNKSEEEEDPITISKYLEDAIKQANESPEQIEYISQETEERIKKTYKDYKQLKKDYAEMKSSFKTEMEFITELLEEFNNTKDKEYLSSNIISLLQDFNYLVDQIDNAVWFIDSGGLNNVILPMVVNQTYLPYRVASLRLLGTLTQNNPKAQIKVYENNFGSYIVNVLLQSSDSDELSTAVYAFGSLLRKFPLAQKEILSQSGTKALISLLQKDIDLKIKSKVLTLIGDLLVDKENVLQLNESNSIDLDKINQYAEVNLLQWLNDNEYCLTITEFINKSYLEIIRKPDIAEDLIDGMNYTSSLCQKLWSENYNFMKILKNIEINFLNSGEEYQVEVGEKIENLISNIGGKYET